MGEKGNTADVAAEVQHVVTAAQHNVIVDTVTSGAGLLTEIATGAVTGAATGVVKDKIDDKLQKDDEPTP
ncbi:MAG: hypothetical protein QOG65_2611 [Actinomycetota bacterium]|jgi:hypothetical protein|nr:hypothetical protein [Actinomycetota bacterium]